MKNLVSIGIVMFIVASFCGCNPNYKKQEPSIYGTEEVYDSPLFVELGEISDRQEDIKELPYSKEYVKEFCDIIEVVEGGGLLSGITLDEENCYNVTPPEVAEQMDVKIFKYTDCCASFILIDGVVYELCMSFGGFGFLSAVPCDYDNDGNLDLLMTSSWGSGLHRTDISYFNVVTKELKTIYSENYYELIIEKNPKVQEGRYDVRRICYVLDMMESGYAPHIDKGVLGYVEIQDGVPMYFSYNSTP